MGKDKKKDQKKSANMASEDTQTVNPAEEKEQTTAENTAEATEQAPQADESEAQKDNKAEELSPEEKLEIDLKEQKDKYVRLYSEFENYRRRTAKEKLDLVKTANEDLVKELLPVLDDLERAAQNNTKEGVELEAVLEGYNLIQNKLVRALEGKGLKKLEIGAGSEFDTEFQEAITQIPAPQENLKGKVVDCVEPGYTLGEKVIRYAKVVTGS